MDASHGVHLDDCEGWLRPMESAILLLLLVPLVLIAFRGSKQRKQVAQMQSSLGPGTEVMTASGQFGYVVTVEGDRVELEISPGVTTWWLRQAIARTVDPVADDDAVDEESVDDDVLSDDDPRHDAVTGTPETRVDDGDDRPDGTRRPA
ncbi:preprotein translocase subunit YajC [Pseudokineococcus basanitobsidens]|uniref:Preprotein translocase subunit YajC n=1 Tax=Pseudokineococcus basanitobsidens TaxID=1926649 RepID=A0ABU8RHW4_9ACTN